jgi:RHS repeat-associated protein
MLVSRFLDMTTLRRLGPKVARAAIKRRSISITLMIALFATTVPPAVASSIAREAVLRAHAEASSFAGSAVLMTRKALLAVPRGGPLGLILAAWLRPKNNSPAVPQDSLGVKPRPPESKVDREGRVASLRMNPAGSVELQSRQTRLFTAIPLDLGGTPIQGLHAEWESSDNQVIFIKKTGQAITGKPGSTTLTARAGRVSETVFITVVEGTNDPFGGKKKADSKRSRSITQDSSQRTIRKTSARHATIASKRHHRKKAGASSRRDRMKPVLAFPFMPSRPPDEDPLPDGETNSLYQASNAVGSPPGKTKPGASTPAAATQGTEHGNQNFTFALPVVGSAGRGPDISLSLVYNSQLWNKSTDTSNNSTWMTYDVDSGWPAQGFRLGFGQIEDQGSSGFTLTDPDGTRHALVHDTGYNYDTTDGTFIHYYGGAGSGTLYYTDGTIVSYGAGGGGYRIYPTRITDRNGNYIEISYAGTNGAGPQISSITDTLERHTCFYYASNGDLVTVTAPGLNGDLQTMRFYYTDITLGTGLFDSTINASGPTSIHTLQYVYLPSSSDGSNAHLGYKFDYSPYGMIGQITQFRGMVVNSSSTTSAGSVTSEGTLAAQTIYNYPGSASSLTDVPKYSERADEWAGRTSGGNAPVYTFATSQGTNEKISTITAPDATISETRTKDNPGQWDDGLVQQTSVIYGSTTLAKTLIDWEPTPTNGPPRVASVRVTDDGSTPRTKGTVFSYTGYNNVSAVSERDFTTDGSISTTELRRTETTYVTSSNYTNRHLLHLPSTVKVFPGGSTIPASRVDYAYDDYGTNHANLTARDDIIMHDPAFDPFHQTQENCNLECVAYDYYHGHLECMDWQLVCNYNNPYDSSTDYRGNVTSVTTYPDANSTSGTITHSTTYDIAGNVMTAQVDCCQLKSITYSGGGTNGNHDYAYPISVTSGNPSGLNLTTSATYDYNTGLMATSTDENGQVTTGYYLSDSLRAEHVTYPDGGAAYVNYSDGLSADANGRYHSYLETSTKLDGSGGSTRYVTSRRYFDGRGAVARTMSNYTSANGWSTQDIEYDAMGRAFRASNPYFAANDSAAINAAGFWTTSTFDHLGRVTQVTMPRGDNDNSLTTNVTSSYDGIYTTVTDQANKVRRQKADALGRMVRLDEPTTSGLGDVSSPNQPSAYDYDVLDNLVHINQGSQDRYFKYDSLSRLIREKQVEQDTNSSYNLSDSLTGNSAWTRKIEYNSSGLITDGYDARGVHTTFSYDDLNRVTQISYSDSTPAAHYYYDSQGLPAGAPSSSSPDYYSRGYSTGRLVAMTYGSGATGNYFGYDNGGRVVQQFQLTGSGPAKYKLSYSYNYAGLLTGETYPSNRALAYAYDDGGRLASVGDGTTTFANSFAFEAHGGLASETFGNAMVHALEYNKRLQANKVKLSQTVSGTTTVLQQYDYGYGQFNTSTGNVDTSKNNGQIGSVTGKINGSTQWLQGFTYDELGRLSNVAEYQSANMSSQTYSQSYTFDRYGNRFQSANSTLGLPAVSASEINAATNRFITSGSTPTTYDAAGNISTDTKFRSLKYDYDANGRQTSVKLMDNTSVQDAVYDCAGQRVQTTAGSSTRTMVYDIFGQDVAEYLGSSGTTLERENIYRGGQLLATSETLSGAPPSSLAATPSTTNIALSWSGSAGNYRVERKGAGGSYERLTTTPSTSTTDSGASSGSAYLYRVCAADGSGNCTSDYSNIAMGARLNFTTDATIISYSENPATATSIKAAHITELRTAINAVRSLAGQSSATWTHSGLASGDIIYADDVRDLRARLNDALVALNIQTSNYTDNTIVSYADDPLTATTVKAVHIRELRTRATSGSGNSTSGGGSGGLKYVLSDIQGTTRAVMNNNGSSSAIIARHDYLPFGEEIGAGTGLRTSGQGFGATDTNRWKYGMTERDATSGLDHTWWRKYENIAGRWTSPDPLAGSISNPQSFNRYAYTQNDPVNSVDPDGLDLHEIGHLGGGLPVFGIVTVYDGGSGIDEGLWDLLFGGGGSPIGGGRGAGDAGGGGGGVGGGHEGGHTGPQNPAQPQSGTGAHTQAGDCAHIRANLLGDPRNRSALNDAWNRSQAGTSNAHEVGGLLGQVIDEGQPYQKDIVINQSYTAPSTSPAGALQGFTNWAQGQIASNSNTVAFGYWYHSHPFKQGTPVANNPGYVYGNPNVPSGGNYDAGVSATLGLRGIIVSRTNVVVFDSSGSILCKFKR